MTEAEILTSLVRRIEAVREEKKLLSGSERDLFAEAKGKNIDGKALRRVLQRRAMDDADREAFDDLVDQYEQALAGKAVAAAALKAGATVREAATKGGISVGAAHAQKTKISEQAIPKSSAVAAPVASPLPLADAGAPPTAALDTPDDANWRAKDGAASYELAHRIAGGKEPAGDVDTAKTQAVIAALNAKAASKEQLVAALDGDPGLIDRRRA